MNPTKTWAERLARTVDTAVIESGKSRRIVATGSGIPKTNLTRRLDGDVEFKGSELRAVARALDLPADRAGQWFADAERSHLIPTQRQHKES